MKEARPACDYPGRRSPLDPIRSERYQRAAASYGDAIARLARGYEADAERRDELLQEIHLQLWRSFASFDGRCSERTWVFRVAHNVAASHVDGERRRSRPTVPLHELDPGDGASLHDQLERRHAVEVVSRLVKELPTLDRQVVLLYLEGLKASEIGEVVGISASAVATRLHRLKDRLARQVAGREP